MVTPLHPIVIGALEEIQRGLATLESEIADAASPADALRLHDRIQIVSADVDRVELAALLRAGALCATPSAWIDDDEPEQQNARQ